DAFGGVGNEEVIVKEGLEEEALVEFMVEWFEEDEDGEGVVVTSSSLEMLTNSYLGGIVVSLIFLEGLEEEALVEFMWTEFWMVHLEELEMKKLL
nr:hypothetical protein [Tanacetum cinerariifolium]